VMANFSPFLTDISDCFKLLRARICPLIVHVIRNKKEFPSLVRVMRIATKLVIYFPEILVEEAQVLAINFFFSVSCFLDYNYTTRASS
jgi:hypothetical protein